MKKFTAFAAAAMYCAAAISAVPAEQAKELGGDKLTAFGAERSGNKDGTIPPYLGKGVQAPASYDLKDAGQRPSPYTDKPLFTITARNAAQYSDRLDGMSEVFKKFPDFRMDVYPTHRDIIYPKYVLDHTLKNATSCKASSHELKLEGCYGGIPFPIPKTGNEMMWNHLLAYSAYAAQVEIESTLTPPTGTGLLQGRSLVTEQWDYYDPKDDKPRAANSTFWRVVAATDAPARANGTGLLIIDNLDFVEVGRRAWQYLPGQRRVKLSPNLAYDIPNPLSGGTSLMDEVRVFLGALDRFDFKLIGKKEKFIPYDNFGVTYQKTCTRDKVINNRNFPNPDCVRWELHRVWQVEATLKPEFRHAYAKRIFFWDEDQPGSGVGENYDASGKLYRVGLVLSYPFYDSEGGAAIDPTVVMDLQTGAWGMQGLTSEPGEGFKLISPKNDSFYSPESLAGNGIR